MPFGFKNVGATYQLFVNKMLKEQIGKTMELYIDDMLVESVKEKDHLEHMRRTFDIKEKYRMKLNPKKCTFEVTTVFFLGQVLT